MRVSPERGWRFLLPDLDAPEEEAGLALEPSGRLSMVEGRRAVRQAVLLLLSTRPGERVMRPAYGCDLDRLVFAPADATSAGLAIHYVRRALTTWEPRIEILHLDADAAPGGEPRLDLTLVYRVRSTHVEDRIELGLPLDGSLAGEDGPEGDHSR